MAYDDQTGRRESIKLLFDFFKHVTTLSSASLMLMMVVLEKIVNNLSSKEDLKNAIVALILAILTSMISMSGLAFVMRHRNWATTWYVEAFFQLAFLVALCFFLGGMWNVGGFVMNELHIVESVVKAESVVHK